jgi:hypothetical protein
MKKLLLLAFLISGNLMAGSRVILDDQKAMDAEVNDRTVKCSALGYGAAELKINIKGLDGWTILDHSNDRFGDKSGLPCMTAGMCKFPFEEQGFEINDVIQNNPRVEKVVVHRVITETRELNRDGFCARSLVETLETTVGGIKFNHARYLEDKVLPKMSCNF